MTTDDVKKVQTDSRKISSENVDMHNKTT